MDAEKGWSLSQRSSGERQGTPWGGGVFWGKPEYPERPYTYTGRTFKLHTEKPQLGIEPGTLSL